MASSTASIKGKSSGSSVKGPVKVGSVPVLSETGSPTFLEVAAGKKPVPIPGKKHVSIVDPKTPVEVYHDDSEIGATIVGSSGLDSRASVDGSSRSTAKIISEKRDELISELNMFSTALSGRVADVHFEFNLSVSDGLERAAKKFDKELYDLPVSAEASGLVSSSYADFVI